MRLLIVPPESLAWEAAIGRSGSLLELAKSEHGVAATASWVRGSEPIVVLGALQRAGRVLDRFERTIRRSTTGTGFTLRGGLLVSIALPYVDAVFGDATPRTILNRNLRPVMKGLHRAGIATQYWGREWLAWRRRALFVIGLDVDRDGAVLIEAYATLSGALSIAPDAASALETSCDRYRGYPTASLEDAGIDEAALPRVALAVLEGIVERVGLVTSRLSDRELAIDPARVATVVHGPFDPLPNGAVRLLPAVSVPIGFLDVARVGDRTWVGGDVLAPAFALGFESGLDIGQDLPMEGALWEDVRRARQLVGASG